MITREDLRELTRIRDAGNCAVSFYFQPASPRNKAHKEQVIQAKDMVRDALREIAGNGNDACARADLEKVCVLAEQWQAGSSRARAVFANGKGNFWQEFDLPPVLAGSQLLVGQRFHLKPLAALLGAQPRLGVVLVDRQRARLFEMHLEELTEQTSLFHLLSRRGRSDGFAGYDGGRAQRQVADEAQRHYRLVAATLKEQAEGGIWDHLIVGCHETNWPELEPLLHPYVKQRLLGHFNADVATAKNEDIRLRASTMFYESLDRRRHEMVHQAVGKARGHREGVTGLRRVLRALELGEVRTLMIGENYAGHAVECLKCGHLDAHIVRYCSICGSMTKSVDDVSEGLIPLAIRRDAEIVFIHDPELDSAGNIAALLRYRAETARPARLSA